ncbi:hypothetical protein ACQEV9_45850 [Streptomyces chartreusis]|uniref:hypothetical protein n=1 Tax=Streptomyces chartreusis TaxID=1969 RepID=UPI003D8B0F9B
MLPVSVHGWATALLGSLDLGVSCLAAFLIHPRGFGRRDVFLAYAVGAVLGWFGWAIIVFGAFAGFLIGAAYRVGLVLAAPTGRRPTVVSVSLVAGTTLGVLLGMWTH